MLLIAKYAIIKPSMTDQLRLPIEDAMPEAPRVAPPEHMGATAVAREATLVPPTLLEEQQPIDTSKVAPAPVDKGRSSKNIYWGDWKNDA